MFIAIFYRETSTSRRDTVTSISAVPISYQRGTLNHSSTSRCSNGSVTGSVTTCDVTAVLCAYVECVNNGFVCVAACLCD